jgi:hypothetical protein
MEKSLFEQNGILTIGRAIFSFPNLCRLKAFLSVSVASGGRCCSTPRWAPTRRCNRRQKAEEKALGLFLCFFDPLIFPPREI